MIKSIEYVPSYRGKNGVCKTVQSWTAIVECETRIVRVQGFRSKRQAVQHFQNA